MKIAKITKFVIIYKINIGMINLLLIEGKLVSYGRLIYMLR